MKNSFTHQHTTPTMFNRLRVQVFRLQKLKGWLPALLLHSWRIKKGCRWKTLLLINIQPQPCPPSPSPPTQNKWLQSAPTYPQPYFTYWRQHCYETEFCLYNGF